MNSVISEPHFRPASTSSKSTTTTPTPTTRTTATSPTELTFISDNEVDVQDNNVTSNSPNISELKTVSVENDTEEAVKDYKIDQPDNMKTASKSEAATISTTLRIFLPSKLPQASITPPNEDEMESTTEYAADNVTHSDEHSTRQKDQSNDNKEETISDASPKQANVRPSENMEGQLFQDVVPKEEPIFNSRGV